MNSFELKVLQGLQSCGFFLEYPLKKTVTIGAGVSGGADSISLLFSLCKLSKICNFNIEVVTVNHNIRPKEETAGDADFVMELCNQLKKQGFSVNCCVKEIDKGLVSKMAEERGAGVEESARYLRYEIFDSFILENHIEAFCLAHNQNDQLETLLMRFFQGSSGAAASGIQKIRGKYIRPLLEVTRDEIEAYLTTQNLSWRTDSTNFDTDYLRNKIRNNIIPVLNAELSGWQKSVLLGAKKNQKDAEVLQALVEKIKIEHGEEEAFVNSSDYFSLEEALRFRLLLKMCNLVSEESRIPYGFFLDADAAFSKEKDCSKYFGSLEISLKNNKLFVKKSVKTTTDLCFFDIIEEDGKYSFPFGVVEVESSKTEGVKLFLNGVLVPVSVKLPFCLRNSQPGDEVLTAQGNHKKVAEVLTNWKVPENLRTLIPVLCNSSLENEEIQCILGRVAGFNDWIVKE